MDLEHAKVEAKLLSAIQWNTYFHVIKDKDNSYSISKFYNEDAVWWFLKGKGTKHL